MPSIVELIFSAVGTETVASSVSGVSERLGDMTRELGHIATAALTVETAFEGMKGAVEDEGVFTRMSQRIGETVRQTVVLDQAFRNLHLGSEYIAASANLLQKALGGVNDMGLKTDTAFRRLGTSIEELKPLGYADQLRVLSEGFANIANQSDKANIAMQLFGRSGGQLLPLLSDPKALELAEEQAGGLADRAQAGAAAFKALEERINGVTAHIKEMWLAAAQQLLPTMESIAHVIGSINFSSVGAFLGGGAPTIFGATLASMLVNKLDTAVLDWATKEGSPIGQTFAGEFVAPLTGAISKAIPIALAAAIAAGIVEGIIAAMLDARVQALTGHQRAVDRGVSPSLGGAVNVTSREDAASKLSEVRVRIGEVEEKQRRIDAELAGNIAVTTRGQSSAFDRSRAQGQIPTLREEAARLHDQLFALQGVANFLSNPAKVDAQVQANQVAAIRAALEPLVAKIPENEAKNSKLALENMSPVDQARALAAQHADLDTQLAAPLPTGITAQQAYAAKLDIAVKIAEVEKQELEVKGKLTEQEKQQLEAAQKRDIYALETQQKVAEAAGDTVGAQKLKEQIELKQALFSMSGLDLDLAKQRIAAEDQIWQKLQAQKAIRDQIEGERLTLENEISAIRQNLAALDADYTRTDASKWNDRRAAIADEIRTIQQQITADELAKKQASDAGDSAGASAFDKSATGKRRNLAEAQVEQAHLGPNPNNMLAQMRKSLTELQNSIGTTAQQIGHSISGLIGGAFDSVTKNISNAINRTGDFRQAIGLIGQNIQESVVNAAVDMAVKWGENLAIMGAKWLATKLGMAAADKTLQVASVAALIPIAAATSAVWAGPATLATIASFGGAAAAAPEEVLGAMALTQGLAPLAGFKKGGHSGFGSDDDVAGVTHYNEFTFSAPAVRQLGLRNLEAAHQAALRPSVGGAGGGGAGAVAGGGGGADSAQTHNWFFDRKAFARAMASDMRAMAHEVFDERQRS